mgnify:CR=1 FL=1|tara:strand:+ start:104 stop:325 length:222 start_codon:yes stop_codon:yes gene_type:complete
MDIKTQLKKAQLKKTKNYNTHYKNLYINKTYYGEELPAWVIQKRKIREYDIQQKKNFVPYLKSTDKKIILYFD